MAHYKANKVYTEDETEAANIGAEMSTGGSIGSLEEIGISNEYLGEDNKKQTITKRCKTDEAYKGNELTNKELPVTMLSDASRMNLKKKNNIHAVPAIAAVIFIFYIVLQFAAVQFIANLLPTPLKIIDEENNPDAFITERAQTDLLMLTQFGPRLVGSEQNEIIASNYIQSQIKATIALANSAQKIEMDVQKTTGSYFLNFKPDGFVNAYKNITNIIVKIHGKKCKNCLLINAHTDSRETSPGASDDGIMCAVMLEIIRKLSKLNEQPENDIIFLFNGSEEIVLQASHGFITQHKWANNTKVVINLEAAGSGGKEILFQTGPNAPWLLKYYKKIPRPVATSTGEEMFQNNLIPSDTDFRIFRDFGKLIGYDMAFFKDGYRYHTKYDTFDNIPGGSYQHAGDNVLSLVKELSNAPELKNPKAYGQNNCVYFDFLSLFMVSYSQLFAFCLNMSVCCLSTFIAIVCFKDLGQDFRWQHIKCLICTFFGITFGWFCSGICVLAIGFSLDFINKSMSWYGQPKILLGLYCAPIFLISCFILDWLNPYTKENKICISLQSQIQLHYTRLIWTGVLFVGTCLNIRATYNIMIPVLFNAIAFSVIKVLKLQHSVRKWLIICLISTIIPTVFLMYSSYLVMELLIPITGRIGADKYSENIMGALVFILTIVICSYYFPLITLVINKKYFYYGLYFIIFLTLTIILSPLGFPYSGDDLAPTPQRFMIYQTNRVHKDFKENTIEVKNGIFIFNMDRNGPNTINNYITNQSVSIEDDCIKYPACGLPLVSSRMIASIHKSIWIPFSEKPLVTNSVTLNMTSKLNLTKTLTRYDFVLTGPDHMNMLLRTLPGFTMVKTSLADDAPNGTNRFFNFVHTNNESSYEFSIDIAGSVNVEKPSFEIGVWGLFIQNQSPGYIEWLLQFPKWADITPVVANYISYQF